jgi:hypothetical protein
VARRIGFADIGFHFDDDAARDDAAAIVDEHFPEKIAGHVERGPIEKIAPHPTYPTDPTRPTHLPDQT